MINSCNFNSINKITMFISLIILPVLLIITIIYYITLKQKNISEFFQNREISSRYEPEQNFCTFDEKMYLDNYEMRDCEVYFTKDTEECDRLKNSDENNTCKYKIHGWNEFLSSKNKDGMETTYAKKIFTKDATGDLINGSLISKCFRELQDNNKIDYEYQTNNIIQNDCSGGIKNVNTINGKKYASIKFQNSNDNEVNYNKTLDFLCSVRYSPIRELTNMKFLKIELNKENQILSLTRVIMNTNQNELNNDPTFNYGSLTGSASSIGVKYNGGRSFTLFKNAIYQPKNVNIFKFKYNYLCSNSQITEFKTYNENIYTDKLLVISDFRDIQIVIDNSLLDTEFLDKFKEPAKNNRKKEILNEIQIRKDERDTELIAEYETLKKPITSDKNTHEKNYTDTEEYVRNLNLEFDGILSNLGITKGSYTKKRENAIDMNRINQLKNQTILREGGGKVDGLSFTKYNRYHSDRSYKILEDNTRSVVSSGIGAIDFTNIFTASTGINNVNSEEQYSYIWKGILNVPVSTRWIFYTISDDGSYVYINEKLVVDNGGLHGMNYAEGMIYLQSGRDYNIVVVFGENWGGDNFIMGLRRIHYPVWINNMRGYLFSIGNTQVPKTNSEKTVDMRRELINENNFEPQSNLTTTQLSVLPGYTDQQSNLTIQPSNRLTYSTIFYVFIRKGHYKIEALLDCNEKIIIESELYIFPKHNVMRLLSKFETSLNDDFANTSTSVNYKVTKKRKFIYFPYSGFFKIFFKSYAYNMTSRTVNCNFEINGNFVENSRDSININNIKDTDIVDVINKSNISDFRMNYGFGFQKYKNNIDISISERIFSSMYDNPHAINTTEYEKYQKQLRNYDDDLTNYRNAVNNENNLLQHYNILRGIVKNIANSRYNNEVSTIDNKLEKYQSLYNSIANIDYNRNFESPSVSLNFNTQLEDIFENGEKLNFDNYKTIEKYERNMLTTNGSLPEDIKCSLYIKDYST